ncbi:type II toxin-antitoxin system VapC family toxin [soil metagenome]
MIGIDTNVLVRYVVQDDAEQALTATTFLEGHCTTETPGYVSHVVLCELVWTLRKVYRLGKEAVILVLARVLSNAALEVESPELARAALFDFEGNGGDYADYLIARRHQAAGCSHTVTFDRKAATHPLFKLLE